MIIGAIWLAWQGLIRKRATRTIEGTIWMVIACAAAIWLIGQPQDFTGVGTTVSNGVTSVLNTAFDKLPAGNNSNCLPVQTGDPQSVTANYAFNSGSGLVDQNANELWSVLVCKPWLEGEFGTTQYAQLGTAAAKTNLIDEYGRNLLWAQAFATNEQPTAALTQAKQARLQRHRRRTCRPRTPRPTRCSRAISGRPGSRSPSSRCSPRSRPGCWCC